MHFALHNICLENLVDNYIYVYMIIFLSIVLIYIIIYILVYIFYDIKFRLKQGCTVFQEQQYLKAWILWYILIYLIHPNTPVSNTGTNVCFVSLVVRYPGNLMTGILFIIHELVSVNIIHDRWSSVDCRICYGISWVKITQHAWNAWIWWYFVYIVWHAVELVFNFLHLHQKGSWLTRIP